MEYRRRKKSDVWHFHPVCRWWPADMLTRVAPMVPDDVVVSPRRPTYGELCNECRAKSGRDDFIPA